MPLASGTRLGPYQILAAIGAGGMGEVYKARDKRLDLVVAIKVLLPDRVADPECKRRFIKEAQAASARNHPNIVTVHDIGSHEDTSYIVMEWVDGHTLSDMIAAKQLKLADVLKYAIQAADALAQPASSIVTHGGRYIMRWEPRTAVSRKASFTEGTDVTAQFNANARSASEGRRLGRAPAAPAGWTVLSHGHDPVSPIAGQEVFGQGARATRFVWRGPGDRPAFDFNRCQDCGLGHFSLEVDGGVFTVRTDREFIVVPPTLNVGNDAGKGLGTGSGASTVRTAGYQVGLFAVFVGKDAEKLIAMGSEAHKRMGW